MNVLPRSADATGLAFEAAVPMFAASPALEIVQWNAGAEALTGFTAGEVLGRRCWEVLRCDGATRRIHCRCAARAGAAAGEPTPAFDDEIVTKSGARLWVSVTTVLAAREGAPPVRVHLLRELRRQRRLEALLHQVLSAASELASPALPGGERGPSPLGAAPHAITSREREVVRLLAMGSSTAEIAARLGITRRTARNHIQNVLCKLRVNSRLEAVAWASARGLV
jgi:PAS domain S-box-containing protein